MPDISADILQGRVLVVDDQDTDRRLMQAFLASAGYSHVTAVGDPAAAAELHRANRYDLIVLDLLMPGKDGFDVMRELREVEGEALLPVLAVTSDADLMARALQEGARDFIGKPLNRTEVLARVRNMLRERLLMNRLRDRSRTLEEVLVEQSIAGIYVVDDGRFVYANPRLCELLGRSLEELRSIPTVELVVPEDREKLRRNRSRADAGDAGGLVDTYRLLRRDGRVVHLAIEGKFIMRDDRRMLMGIAQDVTERIHASNLLREAEMHYRALVEQSLTGVYILENERLVYANPMLCELVGYGLGELVAMDWRTLVVDEDRGIVDQVLARRRGGETGSIRMRCRVRCKDGRIAHLSVQSKVVELLGRPAVMAMVQDISERVVLSKRILDIQEEERRSISAELHDDIGQSLLALNIGLHRLQESSSGEAARILATCAGMAETLQAKVRELSVELRPPHLEQLGLADALRWLVSRQADITGLRIRMRSTGSRAAGLPSGIETACYRICQEALNNATRHAKASAIVVELVAEPRSLKLTIRDDGVGFDREARRALAGGGMGLVTMEERAELAGGKLDIVSGADAGTTVRAVFPLPDRAPAEP